MNVTTRPSSFLSRLAASKAVRSLAWPFALACGLLMPCAAQAQPSTPPLRILVGFPAGGSTDGTARLLAEKLASRLHRTVVVENKPGAGGAIAAATLKMSPPDGNTLMLAAIVNISIYPSIANPRTYDPFKDLTPVSHVGSYDLALAVSSASGVTDVPSFVAKAKADPQWATFGSPGTGSLPHLFGIQLAQAAGADLVHVPFQGAAPSIMSLLGGQVGAVIQPVSDLLAQYQAGKLRILATTASVRKPSLPDVPTFKELGYQSMEGGGWTGLFAPAGTPRDTIEKLWAATQEVEALPEVAERMRAFGLDTTPMSLEDFAAMTRRDADRWSHVVATAGAGALAKGR